MICPLCEYEYIEGVKTCADCGGNLIPVEEFEGNLLHPSDWTIIYTCDDPIEAEMLKANLDGAEIDSIIIPQKDRNFPSFGDLSVVKLLVKKTDAEEAIAIIKDINSANIDDEE